MCLSAAYLFLHCFAVVGDHLDVYLSHQISLDVYASASHKLSLQYITLPFWKLSTAIPHLYFVQGLHFPSMPFSFLLPAGPLFVCLSLFLLVSIYLVLPPYSSSEPFKLREPPWTLPSSDQSCSQPPHNSGVLNIVLIFFPCDGIVQKVPVPGSRMHPGNFIVFPVH